MILTNMSNNPSLFGSTLLVDEPAGATNPGNNKRSKP
jgi:hypothetical protein